jgi:hypothetical protein
MNQPQELALQDKHEPFEPRTLQLQIVDLGTEQIKVVLRLPIHLVGVAQRLGAQLLPSDRTLEELLAEAGSGALHMQWVDAQSNERLDLTLDQ